MLTVSLLLLLLALPAPSAATECPVDAPVEYSNSYMVWAKGRRHKGVDVYAAKGARVVAPEAGTVTFGSGRKGGLTAYLFGAGVRYYMAHLDGLNLTVEYESGFGGVLRVQPGDLIGWVGNTGNARNTSPHLHIEKRIDGRRVNPWYDLEATCPR